ncbi:MAG: hypothetical protein J0L92_07940 [Deltaproteobacteria bacterium]|nr:hypothetical protein [Deltaproteobacteria bacterium]
MLSNRGWLVVGSLLGVVGVGCGPAAEATDAGNAMDTGAVDTGGGGAPDANRDAAMRMGDAFAAYSDAITAARTQECECRWMDEGYKTLAACVEDQLATGDLLECAEEGYNAARSASAAHYDCVSPALETYASCRMTAGCGEAAGDAITACVETVNAAIQACAELPEEATTVFNECFQREVIGPASMCPEPGAAWMGLGTFMGTTTLGGNDSNPDATCFPDGMIPDTLEISPERAYRWVAPGAGTFVFDTVGTEHDTILYVRSSCTGAFVACNDDIDTEMGNIASRVSVTATMAGQEFIVVVDGFAAEASGEFTVNVTMGTTPDAGPSTTDAAVSIPDAGLPDAPIALDAFAG